MSALLPDALEPVVGWRCWRIRDTREGLVLTSVNRPTRWAPGFALESSCERAGHRGPASACSCGIYAAREPSLVAGAVPPAIRAVSRIVTPAILGYDTVLAVGLVSLWGEVVEAEAGWRGRFAYPRELFVQAAARHYRRHSRASVDILDSDDLARALGELYAVPARVARSLRPDELLRATAELPGARCL
jgi:hypothetical protein